MKVTIVKFIVEKEIRANPQFPSTVQHGFSSPSFVALDSYPEEN